MLSLDMLLILSDCRPAKSTEDPVHGLAKTDDHYYLRRQEANRGQSAQQDRVTEEIRVSYQAVEDPEDLVLPDLSQ